ncbi:MAG: type IV pilus assembly protein PilM, partial [Planctomycetaceae bacterium]|nr:type IV pilus assembly protein PilM [Planctomycetaceae bacterium]
MAENRAAWGIDIGQFALKAIKLRYIESANQVVAEAFDYIQFPKILSQPDAIAEEIVPEAMATFLGRNDLKGDLVSISVPGQSALARFIQLPPVESSKLPEIVKYEARQQIPFALEDVIWDFQPLGAGGEEGGFLLDAEVGLFAMKKDQVYNQLRPYQDAKVEVELIQISPLALYNVLSVDELNIRRDTEGEMGDDYYIVLDMGCDNTTLMVSNGYKIWIRNVPIGGNHFTRALTKEMKLSFAKAEHLKCNATKSPDPRAVFQALRPVFNDYVSEIQRSIGFFSSVNRSAKVVKVIGVGNGFKLAGLQKFLQQNLQYEVERPDNYNSLAGDAVLNSPIFADNILSFAVPYGLGLQALGLSRVQTTLLPPEISRARMIRKKKPWAVATAASLLAGFALSTVGNAFSYHAVHTDEFAAAKKSADDFKSELGSLSSAYDTEKGKFEGTKSKLEELVTGRRDISWMEVFNAVNDCLPRDEGEVPDEIPKKNLISLSEVSSNRVSDVSSWFDALNDNQKLFMTAESKETGPSGEGFIFTLRGKHWHHGETPDDQEVLYLKNQFIRKLQQPTVEVPGYGTRD